MQGIEGIEGIEGMAARKGRGTTCGLVANHLP